MPYDNLYNRAIANELATINDRFATLYAYSPVGGRGMSGGMSGGSDAGVLFQMGNASKRDGENNLYNEDLNLPPQYFYGNNAESMMGGSGFAEGTFRDTGFSHQDGAEDTGGSSSRPLDGGPEGEYEKGMGMSGGNKEMTGMAKDLFGNATPKEFRMLGQMLGQHIKGKGMSGGSILNDIQEGLSDTMGFVPRLFMGGACPDEEVVGGAILGNPDPYPVQGNSQRIAGRGKMTATERKSLQSILAKHPEMTGAGFWDDFKSGFNSVFSPVASVVKTVAPFLGQPEISAGLSALGYGKEKKAPKARGRPKSSKKKELVSPNGDLLAMPAPVAMSNGVPPTSQLRGSYGGAKPSLKESVIKAVEKKMKGGKNLGMTDKREEMKGSGDKRKARALMVKKIMAEKGLGMIQASSYIKQNNIAY